MRKTTITFLVAFFVLSMVLPASAQFVDTDGHWAKQDIVKNYSLNLIKGDGHGHFFPEANISRQETVAVLVRIAGYEADALAAPQDVSQWPNAKKISPWAAGYIRVAQQQGIISLAEINSLEWSAPAQRQEVAAWLSKCLKLAPVESISDTSLQKFSDVDQFAKDKMPYIIPLVQDGIFVGSEGKFKPTANIKRAEVAAITSRAFERYPITPQCNCFFGQIYSISTITITIQTLCGEQNTFYLPENCALYLSGQEISRSEISRGDWLFALVDNSGYLTYGEVYPSWFTKDHTSSISNSGELIKMDLNSGFIDVKFLDKPLRYRLSPKLSSDICTSFLEPGNQIVLSGASNWVTSLSKYSETGQYVIYKASSFNVNTQQNTIEIGPKNLYYLGNTWEIVESSFSLPIDSNTYLYKYQETIDLEQLESYEDEGIYIVYSPAKNKVLKARLQEGRDAIAEGTISLIQDLNSRFFLNGNPLPIVYGNYSVIIYNNQITHHGILKKGMEVTVYIDESNNVNKAAIILIK